MPGGKTDVSLPHGSTRLSPGCSPCTGADYQHPRRQDENDSAPLRSKFCWLITCAPKNLRFISHLNLSDFTLQLAVLVLPLCWIKEPSVPGLLPITSLTKINQVPSQSS